jgi:hypothetical protein
MRFLRRGNRGGRLFLQLVFVKEMSGAKGKRLMADKFFS